LLSENFSQFKLFDVGGEEEGEKEKGLVELIFLVVGKPKELTK
jgi:hypothetical protein